MTRSAYRAHLCLRGGLIHQYVGKPFIVAVIIPPIAEPKHVNLLVPDMQFSKFHHTAVNARHQKEAAGQGTRTSRRRRRERGRARGANPVEDVHTLSTFPWLLTGGCQDPLPESNTSTALSR